ncbi:MAG: response regulator [Candidatus Hydrogenedentes bacterium]|nr:response regulator [Candidatus Hydrogenedentota bacterium]
MEHHDEKQLNVLIVEDSTDDLMLLLATLRKAGIDIRFEQVEDALRFESALARSHWDVVISDFNLPNFTGMEALELLRKHDADLPFLLVSGTIGEERAVEAVKAGANDYVMKENLTRLPSVIEREVREARHRRKRREAEATAMRLLRAIQQANEGIAIITPSWTLEYANQAFANITGISANANGRVRSHVVGEDVDRNRTIDDAIRSLTTWSGRYETVRPDGSDYVLDLKLNPIGNGTGDLTSIVVIARDVSIEERREAQLNQAQRLEALGTLAGGIAHDFNNILTAMVGYTEMAIADVEDDGVQSDLQKVLRAGDRAKRLIRQILTISRRQSEDWVNLYPQMAVNEAIEFLRASLPATIDLRAYVSNACPMISADPTHLNQIVMNLCTNAAHAMGAKGGLIEIELEPVMLNGTETQALISRGPEVYVRLRVRDHGHGMDRETMARIFDPFFTTKELGEGTGLGLATVHSIVTSLGGVITVDSETGKGTVFEVYIPTCETKETEAKPDAAAPSGGLEHILVVDDEQMISELLSRTLTRLKYRVTTAHSAQDALQLIQEDPDQFDLVLTDLTMPKMTGDELARAIRGIRPTIPIILGTGDLGSRGATSRTDFDVCVTKPYNISALSQVIRMALNSRDHNSKGIEVR